MKLSAVDDNVAGGAGWWRVGVTVGWRWQSQSRCLGHTAMTMRESRLLGPEGWVGMGSLGFTQRVP